MSSGIYILNFYNGDTLVKSSKLLKWDFLFFSLSFIYSIVSSAQALDRDIVVNNVDKVTSDHTFLDGDLLSF